MPGLVDTLYLSTIFAFVAVCCAALLIAVLQEPERVTNSLRSLWKVLKKETN
jgi:hypothetical protein